MKQFKDAIMRRRPRPETVDVEAQRPAAPTAPGNPSRDPNAGSGLGSGVGQALGHGQGQSEVYRPRDTIKSLAERLKSPTMEETPKPVRPLNSGSPAPAAMPPAAPLASDRPAVAPAAKAQRQIWDFDADDPAEPARPAVGPAQPMPEMPKPDARSAVDATPALTAQQAALLRNAVPQSAAPGSRAQTRILGFHAAEIQSDVFAAPAKAGSDAGRFPCGWIVVVEGAGRGASFSIGSGMSTIGRGEDQAICLDFGDMSISRSGHAMVAYDEEQNKFFVGHGGKSNVVRRNGNPILTTEQLEDGDLIRIGKTTLRFVALCGSDFTWGSGADEAEQDDQGV